MAVLDYNRFPHIIERILVHSPTARLLRTMRLTCWGIKHHIDTHTQSLWALVDHPRTTLTPWRRTFFLFGGLHRSEVRVIEIYAPNGHARPTRWHSWAAPLCPLTAVNWRIYRAHPYLILPALTRRYQIESRDFYKDTPLSKLVKMVARATTRGDPWVVVGMEGWNALVSVAPQSAQSEKSRSFKDCFVRAVQYRRRCREKKRKALEQTQVQGIKDVNLDMMRRETYVHTLGREIVQMLDDASRALHC